MDTRDLSPAAHTRHFSPLGSLKRKAFSGPPLSSCFGLLVLTFGLCLGCEEEAADSGEDADSGLGGARNGEDGDESDTGGTSSSSGGSSDGVDPGVDTVGVPAGYTGTPFMDSVYPGGPQMIPGRVQCEFYDFGGPDVAYFDHDANNSGSGGLNPIDGSYLHGFRADEAVDTSFTKAYGVDDSEFNMVQPEIDQLYVGWTGVGEWFNLTVKIEQAGTYSVNVMYTVNGPGAVSLALNNTSIGDNLALVDTNNPNETTDWRQWHHWNKMELTKVALPAGTHLLTVKIAANGAMNLDYLEFTLVP